MAEIKKQNYQKVRAKLKKTLYFVILIVQEYLILDFCISGMKVDVCINFWFSLKNKKTTKVNFRCLRRNHQQKIRWFLLSKKKKTSSYVSFLLFLQFFFCFLHLNQVFWDFRGTIRPSPIKRFILKLRGVCTSQDIFKRKQKIEIKKKTLFLFTLLLCLTEI